jgi:hypothetical protein
MEFFHRLALPADNQQVSVSGTINVFFLTLNTLLIIIPLSENKNHAKYLIPNSLTIL